jgi:hypothetical protein
MPYSCVHTVIQRRNAYAIARVSPAEKAELRREALLRNMTVSDLMRERLFPKENLENADNEVRHPSEVPAANSPT